MNGQFSVAANAIRQLGLGKGIHPAQSQQRALPRNRIPAQTPPAGMVKVARSFGRLLRAGLLRDPRLEVKEGDALHRGRIPAMAAGEIEQVRLGGGDPVDLVGSHAHLWNQHRLTEPLKV